MKRAEKAALNMYPVEIVGYSTECRVGAHPKPLDWNEGNRAACIKGYRKGEDETIRRAAKWLRKAFTSKIVGDYGSPSRFVSAFKEAMKEETK